MSATIDPLFAEVQQLAAGLREVVEMFERGTAAVLWTAGEGTDSALRWATIDSPRNGLAQPELN